MAHKKLQKNTKLNLLRTLNDISSSDRQQEYKQQVPFVHVPIELLEQWSQYSRLLNEEKDWFLDVFTSDEVSAMRTFDMVVQNFNRIRGDDIVDVPEIFDDKEWIKLKYQANNLLSIISKS